MHKSGKKILYVIIVSTIAIALAFGAYYSYTHFIAKTDSTRKDKLSGIERVPPEQYFSYFQYEFSLPEGEQVEYDKKHTNFKAIRVGAVSTGEIYEMVLVDQEGIPYGTAEVLRVFLDDGSTEPQEYNTFNVVLKFIPKDRDHSISPDLIKSVLYQNKIEEVAKNLEEDGSLNQEKMKEVLSNLRISDEEVARTDLSVIFNYGEKFNIIPYVKEGFYDYVQYIENTPELKKYFSEDYFEYFEIVDKYYLGRDSGFNQRDKVINMDMVVEPVFLAF